MIRLIAALCLVIGLWLSAATLFGSTVERLVAQEVAVGAPAAGRPGDSAVLTQALERLGFASMIDPWHTGVLSRLAQIQGDQEALHTRRRLVEIGPGLARHWAELFVLKTRLGQWDDEARNALNQAVALGPFEPVLNEQIIRQGLSAWPLLDQAARRSIVEASARALASAADFRKRESERLIQDSGLLPLVCQIKAVHQHPKCDV